MLYRKKVRYYSYTRRFLLTTPVWLTQHHVTDCRRHQRVRQTSLCDSDSMCRMQFFSRDLCQRQRRIKAAVNCDVSIHYATLNIQKGLVHIDYIDLSNKKSVPGQQRSKPSSHFSRQRARVCKHWTIIRMLYLV